MTTESAIKVSAMAFMDILLGWARPAIAGPHTQQDSPASTDNPVLGAWDHQNIVPSRAVVVRGLGCLKADGLGPAAIAEQLGIGRGSVYRALRV
jgi:hypothetical protein